MMAFIVTLNSKIIKIFKKSIMLVHTIINPKPYRASLKLGYQKDILLWIFQPIDITTK